MQASTRTGDTPRAALAVVIERELAMGRSALTWLQHAELRSRQDLPPALTLALGRAAEDEQLFGDARDLFERAALGDDAEVAGRAHAHLAYLDYYVGNCESGLAMAQAVSRTSRGIAACEGHLYASVNAIALNRPLDALAEANAARNLSGHVRDRLIRLDLRFRIARQLAHVFVPHGDYSAAASEAEAAFAIARTTASPRHLGLAAYLRGYVRAARGDPLALTLFRDADRDWGGASRPFGRWLQFAWAVALRDLGNVAGARNLRLASGVRVPWEEPLFELAEGTAPTIPEMTPAPADEIPFRLAARGVCFLALGRREEARDALTLATREFERCEFHHYRRGAVMNLAAVLLDDGDANGAIEIVRAELPEILRQDLRTWPWWYRPAATRLARACIERGLAADHWRQMLHSAHHAETPLSDILRARDLTERQIDLVRAWLAEPDRSRAALAATLGIGEASVRAHLNAIRRKLGCDQRRGAAALRERIDALAGAYRMA